MTIHTTHCALRLGDNLAHLHFLRKLAAAYPDHGFTHFCHGDYLDQLREVVSDIPRIRLTAFAEAYFVSRWEMRPPDALGSTNAWKNSSGFFDRHPQKETYSAVMLDWYHELARRLGLESPLHTREDLLFDYPALNAKKIKFQSDPFDILIVNSPPLSGQAPRFYSEQMDSLIGRLAQSYRIVTTFRRPGLDLPCTMDLNATVTGIGRLSQVCNAIVMVSTGPSWPTFNIWNRDSIKLRVVINEPEIVDLDPKAVHVPDVAGAAEAIHARTGVSL